jgi:hypothetical protein
MFQIAGGAVGLGLSTTVFATASERTLDDKIAQAGIRATDQQTDALHGLLAGTDSARDAAAQLDVPLGRLEGFVRDAFIDGFNAVFRVDTALALVGFIVAVVFVGGTLHARRRTAAEEPSA